ncbi:GNAT family N-acetyltransferase [Chryseomicrobium palamuruense]|uniref:GNAT family N-acetyltransferase n=1 Tax=Chryseomicrobium palamuruense TaxID=682973 RepID=A0ABV8V0U1_9BACL
MMNESTTIQLVDYQPMHYEVLTQIDIPDEQREFTSLPVEKINSPLVEASACHVVILHNEEPIGYFALEEGKKLQKYSANTHAKLLTAFSIDYRHQGKGYAKAALHQLPDFVRKRYPHVDEIVLGVNQGNIVAASLYRKLGFIDHGEVFVGPKGPQHIMHLSLNKTENS